MYIYAYGAVPDCMNADQCICHEANILGTLSCVLDP